MAEKVQLTSEDETCSSEDSHNSLSSISISFFLISPPLSHSLSLSLSHLRLCLTSWPLPLQFFWSVLQRCNAIIHSIHHDPGSTRHKDTITNLLRQAQGHCIINLLLIQYHNPIVLASLYEQSKLHKWIIELHQNTSYSWNCISTKFMIDRRQQKVDTPNQHLCQVKENIASSYLWRELGLW